VCTGLKRTERKIQKTYAVLEFLLCDTISRELGSSIKNVSFFPFFVSRSVGTQLLSEAAVRTRKLVGEFKCKKYFRETLRVNDNCLLDVLCIAYRWIARDLTHFGDPVQICVGEHVVGPGRGTSGRDRRGENDEVFQLRHEFPAQRVQISDHFGHCVSGRHEVALVQRLQNTGFRRL